MSGWVRLWHDMPTDPKWRVIARKSSQRVGDVIAVFNFLMVSASANANERGRTHGIVYEDIAAALDLPDDAVSDIINAMTGKVMDADGYLTGWEKRQPKREDSSAERAKRWRDERKRTQANASERPDIDIDSEVDSKKEAKASSSSAPPKRSAKSEDFDQFWSAYPAKVGKKAAERAWSKAKDRPPIGEILRALDRYRASKPPDRDWCHPTTWINQGRWDDQAEESGKVVSLRGSEPVISDPELRARYEAIRGQKV